VSAPARQPDGRRHRRPDLPRQGGFTLIEAIAAFVLLSLFLGILMSALSTAMRQTVRAEQESLAAQWAQSKLDLVGIGEKLETGDSNGRFDDAFEWRMTVEQYEPVRDEPLVVAWGRGASEREAHFTTLRAYSPDQAVLFNNPDAAGLPGQAGADGQMVGGGRGDGGRGDDGSQTQ
jgi:type II secretory pathway pseudopilin PulG